MVYLALWIGLIRVNLNEDFTKRLSAYRMLIYVPLSFAGELE